MKNFKTIIAILAISIASVLPASAITNTEINPASKAAKTILRAEIVELLGHHEYNFDIKVLEAQVSVMLNNKNELVVLDVKTDSKTVAKFVKSKLNYKKVNVKGIKKRTVFRIPLKMTFTN